MRQWGKIAPDTKEQNEYSISHLDGFPIHSIWKINGIKFWIMTEGDKSATTLLLPEDY